MVMGLAGKVWAEASGAMQAVQASAISARRMRMVLSPLK
jgi:hypothetical protein